MWTGICRKLLSSHVDVQPSLRCYNSIRSLLLPHKHLSTLAVARTASIYMYFHANGPVKHTLLALLQFCVTHFSHTLISFTIVQTPFKHLACGSQQRELYMTGNTDLEWKNSITCHANKKEMHMLMYGICF